MTPLPMESRRTVLLLFTKYGTTGAVGGLAFGACIASVVCGAAGAVAIGGGIVVSGGLAHLGVDALSHDDANDFTPR